jgi:hypothetical protein
VIGYAETHYRFRLPWSPLWRDRPEAIVDAPTRVLPGRDVPLFLAVHDAHRFPRRLRGVRVVVRAGGELLKASRDFDLPLDRPFHFLDLPWPGPEIPGPNLVDALFELEDAKGRRARFLNHDLPGVPPTTLVVDRLPAAPALPAGWVCGDLHCHTTWSEDPVEWGGDPQVMRRAAHAMGLDFFSANDHSYDFAWDHPDWMAPADPARRFAAFRRELSATDGDGLPLALACEEVSCGNARGRNVHLIVCEHPEYIPGQGDGGRRWLRNRPDLSIGEVLDRASLSDAPAWAAHPRAPMGALQRALFRRGSWEDADLDPRLAGLQFWNGRRGTDFSEGRAQWLRSVLRGGSFLPLAGNDAHGDLNRAFQVDIPLVSVRQTTAHRFGHARTWLATDAASPSPDRSGLKRLLASRPPVVVSDGPWLSLRAPGAAHPRARSGSGALELEGAALPGSQGLREARIYGQRAGEAGETLVARFDLAGSPSLSERLPCPAGLRWVRAELDGLEPVSRTEQAAKALTGIVAIG